jgi:hypothetical protein
MAGKPKFRRALLVVADVIAWLLTVNAQANFHAPPGGAATTLGIVLGFIISSGLFVAVVLLLLADRQAAKSQRPTSRPASGS